MLFKTIIILTQNTYFIIHTIFKPLCTVANHFTIQLAVDMVARRLNRTASNQLTDRPPDNTLQCLKPRNLTNSDSLSKTL
jgi:hypothetical protein